MHLLRGFIILSAATAAVSLNALHCSRKICIQRIRPQFMSDNFSPPKTLEDEELGPGAIVCGGVLDESEEIAVAEKVVEQVPAPYKPKILWWCTSELEEDRELNFAVNSAFLIFIVLSVSLRLVIPTLGSSRGWTAEEFLLRLPIDNWQGYLSLLRAHPILIKAMTSGTVYALGDWTAQTTNGTPLADLDRGRVLRSAIAGFIGHGPLSHFWYTVCEYLFNFIGWNENWWVVLPKVVTDQLLWSPIWNAVYIMLIGAMKLDSVSRIIEAIISTSVPLIVSGLKLWPAVHVITYGVIPEENRLLWVDTVEILWVTILSRQAAEEAKKGEKATPLH